MKVTSSQIAEITGGRLFGPPDISIQDIVTDSRLPVYSDEQVFVAIHGKNHDGHNFISNLYNSGIKVFIVEVLPSNISDYIKTAFILVDNTINALQQLGTWKRKQFKSTVIAITGSAGKTIVKEWLADILGMTMPVIRSPKSYNSQIGVPLSVWQLDKKYELGIFEAGISQPGEMEKLRKIIEPDIGVFTTIGDAHSENFKNLDQKIEEKLKLFSNASVLVFCADFDLLEKHISKSSMFKGKRVISWSEGNTDALVKVKLHTSSGNDSHFDIFYEGKNYEFVIPFSDRASFENAVNVAIVCLFLGVETSVLCKGLSNLASVAMRMEIKNGINNCMLIEDFYNSDPGSLRMAIDYLKSQNGRKSTLILSDFLQSERNETDLYGSVAKDLQIYGINKFIGIGEALSRNRLLFPQEAVFYKSTAEFIRDFNSIDFKNEVILLKGARIFEFELIAKLLEEQIHQTVLEVNLDAISHNLNELRRCLKPGTRIMAMVKAFAYGAGPSEIATLLAYHRVSYLGVAYADEGVVLRNAGVTLPIMVMNPDPSASDIMIRYNLEPEIFSFASFEHFSSVASKHGLINYPIHLKIDSGMHRLGFMPGDIEKLVQLIKMTDCIKIASVFSHLAASEDPAYDDFTNHQASVFLEAVKKIETACGYSFIRHILNSSGIVRHPQYQFEMVRPGIAIYGVGKFEGLEMKIAGRFKSRISQIKIIPAGEPVGYGCTDVSDIERTIAIVPVGYADGFSRKLGNRNGSFFINRTRVPVIGNVCMDMCMADITGLNVNEGDEAEIFGDNIPIEELAEKCGTIPYEILTSIPGRVKRIFIRE